MEKERHIKVRLTFCSSKLYTSFMPDTKHPKCDHPKCGAKMQRIYKRDRAAFIPCGWMCTDCGIMQKD